MSHTNPTDTTPDGETTFLQLRGLVAILSPSQALDGEVRDCLALLFEELLERLRPAVRHHCPGCGCEGSPQATA